MKSEIRKNKKGIPVTVYIGAFKGEGKKIRAAFNRVQNSPDKTNQVDTSMSLKMNDTKKSMISFKHHVYDSIVFDSKHIEHHKYNEMVEMISKVDWQAKFKKAKEVRVKP
jgi:hypothetical protein